MLVAFVVIFFGTMFLTLVTSPIWGYFFIRRVEKVKAERQAIADAEAKRKREVDDAILFMARQKGM